MINKRLEFFTNKINTECSDIERITYSEAINLLNDNVNPDKVNNWVSNVLRLFNDKPKPLSQKEILLKEKKNAEFLAKKNAKKEKVEALSKELKSLITDNGLVVTGFFERITEETYNLLQELATKNNYHFADFGDGAYELIVTKKKVNKEFFEKLNDIRYQIEDLNQPDPFLEDTFYTEDTNQFIKKLI